MSSFVAVCLDEKTDDPFEFLCVEEVKLDDEFISCDPMILHWPMYSTQCDKRPSIFKFLSLPIYLDGSYLMASVMTLVVSTSVYDQIKMKKDHHFDALHEWFARITLSLSLSSSLVQLRGVMEVLCWIDVTTKYPNAWMILDKYTHLAVDDDDDDDFLFVSSVFEQLCKHTSSSSMQNVDPHSIPMAQARLLSINRLRPERFPDTRESTIDERLVCNERYGSQWTHWFTIEQKVSLKSRREILDTDRFCQVYFMIEVDWFHFRIVDSCLVSHTIMRHSFPLTWRNAHMHIMGETSSRWEGFFYLIIMNIRKTKFPQKRISNDWKTFFLIAWLLMLFLHLCCFIHHSQFYHQWKWLLQAQERLQTEWRLCEHLQPNQLCSTRRMSFFFSIDTIGRGKGSQLDLEETLFLVIVQSLGQQSQETNRRSIRWELLLSSRKALTLLIQTKQISAWAAQFEFENILNASSNRAIVFHSWKMEMWMFTDSYTPGCCSNQHNERNNSTNKYLLQKNNKHGTEKEIRVYCTFETGLMSRFKTELHSLWKKYYVYLGSPVNDVTLKVCPRTQKSLNQLLIKKKSLKSVLNPLHLGKNNLP